MNRRKALTIATVTVTFVGFLFAVAPFVVSMSPTEAAKSAVSVKIAISDIPMEGALEADYQWYKALVVRNPELQVFLMPYYDGAYQLPDRT